MSTSDVVRPSLFVSLLGVLLVAVVAARLLGVRRSVPANLLSGVLGWVAGVGLSTVIAHSQPNPNAGFMRNVWVFSTVFTMSAIVWAELLARPGTLARAQSGLIRPARPWRRLRRRMQRIARYAQISRVAVRHGLGPALGLSRVTEVGLSDASAASGSTGARLRRALEECGGIFVKLGQVMSTRSDLLPASVCDELARLQDDVRPAAPADMQQMLREELRTAVEDVFADFDWEPIAAASIGQAYRARLRSGEQVVVKIQRPGIAEAIARDIDVLSELARVMEQRTAWARQYRVGDLIGEFAELLRGELDFRAEARNAVEIGANLGADAAIRVPHVFGALSTGRVLIMEWLDGTSVRQADPAPDVSRQHLADQLLRSILKQILTDGRFHADPHPGNVLLVGGDRLALIDFGAVGRLDALQQAALRDLLVSVAQADPAALRDAVVQIAEPRRDLDELALERALARFTARQLGPGATPSAAMLSDLVKLCFTFGLTLPPDVTTVFRALATVEGTLRTLCPGYLAIDSAQRIAAEWARERVNLDGVSDLARDEVMRLLPVLRRLPPHVDRLLAQVQRGQLQGRVSLFGDAHDQGFVTQLVNRVVLAFLGAMLGVLSAILLGSSGGPVFTGSTSLFQFFGYFGLFCATVLILRVLVAVLHDGPS